MVAEQVVNGVLLALHNLALVGCAAAPFYNRNLVGRRAQFGPKLRYDLDKVVEETLQGNAPYCMAFIAVLFATGMGMPLVHFLFHGAFREMHAVAWVALGTKLALVSGMVVIMGMIFLGINPRLRELFAGFEAGKAPDAAREKEFFGKRARRKALCDICLWLAMGVLVSSAFIGFGR